MITSWGELEKWIQRVESNSSEYYYRGYQNNCQLISSLGRRRLGDGFSSFKEFAYKMLQSFELCDFTFLDMVKAAQHYGIPTNLIDLTIDPCVALFFGLGKSLKSYSAEYDGHFHILYCDKSAFDENHKEEIKDELTVWGDVVPFSWCDLQKNTWDQVSGLKAKSILTENWVTSLLFQTQYNDFMDIQEDYLLIRYQKPHNQSSVWSNTRLMEQKGLFVMMRDESQELPVEWFKTIDVSLSRKDSKRLKDYLNGRNYTACRLLSSEINGVNIENDIVHPIMSRM